MPVERRLRHMVQVPRGVRHPEPVREPPLLPRDPQRHGVQHDAPGVQSVHTHPKRQRLRAVVRSGDMQSPERSALRPQKIVEYVVPSGLGLQPEARKHVLQLLHVERLFPQLPPQRLRGARCGREERIGRRGGRERQYEIPGPDLGPDRRRVGPDGHARGTDAVGTVSVAYPDTVQRQRGGIGPLLRGRGAEVEAEGPADPVRRHAQRRQIELRDTPRQPYRLPLAGHLSREVQRQTQRLVAIGDPARKAAALQHGVDPDAAEIASGILQTLRSGAHRDHRLRREGIETRAAGLRREIDRPERIGRQERPEREAVAPHPRFVGLSRRIEPSRGREAASADLKRRIRRHRTAVQLRRAAQGHPRGNRHAAAQRRVGQQRFEKLQFAEIPLETDRNGRRPSFRQVLRPAFRPQAAMPGHGELQPDPAQVGQCPGGRQRQAHLAVAQRLRNREQQPHVPCREIGAKRSPDLRCGSQSERPGARLHVGVDPRRSRGETEALQRHGPAVLHEPSRGRTHGQPAALGEVQPFDPQGDVASPVIHRIEREIERRERDRLRIESRRRRMPHRAVGRTVVRQFDAPHADGPGSRRAGSTLCGIFRSMSRAGFRRKFRGALRSAPLFRCNLPGRRCNVGVHAARQSHAGHLDPRTVQSDAAVVHLALGQPHGKLRGVGRGPHPKGRIGHRNPPYGDLPRQGRRAVGPLLRGLPDLQADRRVPVRQRDPENIGRPGLQIDPGEIHPEPSGRKTHVRSRDGIAVTGRKIPEFEIADHRPAAKQRQQGDVERQPSAADKRVPALSQQHVVRRQAERKSEPDAADRKFHAERPGDGPFRPDAHEVLHRRDIERCGNQDQRRDEAQQRAERIFDDFSPVHFSRRRPEASTFRDRPSKTTASYENSGSCPKAFRHIRPDSRHLSFFLPAGCPGTAETARFFPRSPAIPKRPPP